LSSRKTVATGSVKNAGYYTIEFDKKIEVKPGQRFAVIVYIKTPNVKKPVAVEMIRDFASINVDLSDGEGYISINGQDWSDTEVEQQCNICLKCYTRNIDENQIRERN